MSIRKYIYILWYCYNDMYGPKCSLGPSGVPQQIVNGFTVSCCHHERRGTTKVFLLETWNANTVMHSANSLTVSGTTHTHIYMYVLKVV